MKTKDYDPVGTYEGDIQRLIDKYRIRASITMKEIECNPEYQKEFKKIVDKYDKSI